MFQLDAAKELDGSAGWIIGFCGREDSSRDGALCELGIVSHQRLPANVLVNCWADCETKRDRVNAENEFAVLLRMRTCKVSCLSLSLDRTTRTVTQVRAT